MGSDFCHLLRNWITWLQTGLSFSCIHLVVKWCNWSIMTLLPFCTVAVFSSSSFFKLFTSLKVVFRICHSFVLRWPFVVHRTLRSNSASLSLCCYIQLCQSFTLLLHPALSVFHSCYIQLCQSFTLLLHPAPSVFHSVATSSSVSLLLCCYIQLCQSFTLLLHPALSVFHSVVMLYLDGWTLWLTGCQDPTPPVFHSVAMLYLDGWTLWPLVWLFRQSITDLWPAGSPEPSVAD